MRKSAGFTLIELVIVIIILGILGAVAAPRLFNLQGDAYGANLNALKSSISTAATMANAKAQIQGQMAAPDTAESAPNKWIKGYEGIAFTNGYPVANAITEKNESAQDEDTSGGILATLDGFEAERYNLNASGGKLTITPKSIDKADITDADDKDISNDACVVIYTVPEKVGESFKIDAYTGGC